jgi:hypothetical protein
VQTRDGEALKKRVAEKRGEARRTARCEREARIS